MVATRTQVPLLIVLLVMVALSSTGCALVEGIFKAGMWLGIFMVLIVLALVIYLAGKVRG